MQREQTIRDLGPATTVLEPGGRDLDDLFESAARLVTERLAGAAPLPGRVQRAIALDAPSLEELLERWVSDLVERALRQGEAFSAVRVVVHAGERPELAAIVSGGPLPRSPMSPPHVRDVTLEHGPAGWRARIRL